MPISEMSIDKFFIQAEKKMLTYWGKFDKPLVSINCITYNHEKYIKDTLEGFLIQKTDFPFEILVHDDASTDHTTDIIREYETRYPNIIKPIYQTVNQYSQGKRIGYLNLQRALGNYIAWCEGDDYWIDPLKLQKQVDFLESHDEYILVHSDGNFYYTESRILKKNHISNSSFSPNSVQKPFEAILRSEYPIITCSVVLRSSFLNNLNKKAMFRFIMGDTFFWLETAQYGKFYFFEESMITRNILVESAAHSKSFAKLLEFKKSGYDLCKYFMEKYQTSDETKNIVHTKFNRVILNYAFKVCNKEVANKAFENLKKNEASILRLEDKLYKSGTANNLFRLIAHILLLPLKVKKRFFK